MRFNHKLFVSFSLCLFISSFQSLAQEMKEITGVITFQDAPVQDVNLRIQGTDRGAKTDINGSYSIDAKKGDVLEFTHVGFEKVTIIVEDVTSELNLVLDEKANQLSETIVTAEGTQINSSSGIEYDTNTRIKTAAGYINPFLFPSTVYYYPSKELGLDRFATIEDALKWKMPKDKIPGIYDIDGVVFKGSPLVDMARVKDVYVITGAAGTMRWGGPVIIVRTLDHPDEIKERKEKVAEQYRNPNFYGGNAASIDPETVFSSSNLGDAPMTSTENRTVYGIITHKDKSLVNVNVRVKNKAIETKTDNKGYYMLEASIGDEIVYSHSSMQTMIIRVEDVTDEINLDMLTNTNTLDEIVVNANNRRRAYESGVLKQARKKEEPFQTARGEFNPKRAGYSIAYVDGEELNPANLSIGAALNGKVAGVSGSGHVPGESAVKLTRSLGVSEGDTGLAIWDVDGVIYMSDPFIDVTNVKDIHIIKSLAGTTRYGSLGKNGVVVVRTKSGSFDINEKRKRITERYKNKAYYNGDAKTIDINESNVNDHTKTIEAFQNKKKAFDYYNVNLKGAIEDFDIHIAIAQKFLMHFKDKDKAIKILTDLAIAHNSNPEILKAIGFNLQAMEATKDALEVFKMVGRSRPDYAQSYRDLANAYKENNEFKMAWRIYMFYLLNRNVVKASAIDQIVYNEMEYLYFNRENQTDIKEQFVPNNESKIKFRNDVRFVVEWNTSEAEFDLEFVGPDKRVYVLEHTLHKNQDLIHDEKRKGISSDEFFVEDIGSNEWLMNLTYFGNKKSAPTYLKVTTFYHWGKPKQRQEIAVYKLDRKNYKMQLKKINSQTLLAINP